MEKKQLEYSARAGTQEARWHKFLGTVDGARIRAVDLAKNATLSSVHRGSGATISVRDAVTKETLEEFAL